MWIERVSRALKSTMRDVTVSAEKGGVLSAMGGLGGFLGRILLPLGLFSVLAVGLHVGSDKIDDHLFVIISWLDSLADLAATFLIRAIGGLFSDSRQTIEIWTFKAIEFIDV